MTITVVNCRIGRHKGPGEYIGRPSPLGNPFKVAPHGPYERGKTIELYRKWLTDIWNTGGHNAQILELYRLAEIAVEGDLNLMCWCAPKPCHGDVIKELIETKVAQGLGDSQ